MVFINHNNLPACALSSIYDSELRRQKLITRGQELAQGVLHYTQAGHKFTQANSLCLEMIQRHYKQTLKIHRREERSQFNLQTASKSFPFSFEAIQLFFSTASLRQSLQRVLETGLRKFIPKCQNYLMAFLKNSRY